MYFLRDVRNRQLLAIAKAPAPGIRPSITLMHVAGIAIWFAMAVYLGAQSASDTAWAFEVASVKKHLFTGEVSGPCGGVSISGNRVTIPCIQLRNLIIKAFGVKPFQIVGGPRWLQDMDDVAYDIVANAPGSVAPTKDQVNMLLQALLASRFRLRIHRESRDLPVYALVLDKQKSKPEKAPSDARPAVGYSSDGSRGWFRASRESMPAFVIYLSDQVGRPVLDKTGLTGYYRFTLEWACDEPGAPSLLTALKEQLGLKLEPQKGAVELIVIDDASRPSEN
jgi:uncharacterized protein (TIGR03435 family)